MYQIAIDFNQATGEVQVRAPQNVALNMALLRKVADMMQAQVLAPQGAVRAPSPNEVQQLLNGR